MSVLSSIIKDSIDILRNGGVILYPTDTIWGLGCDATNDDAIEKIHRIKKSKGKGAMLVLLDSDSRIPSYIREVPPIAYELIKVSDKPLTIIYPGAKNISERIIAADGSLGIRIVKDEFCSKLIERFRKPIVSTSANISGESSPVDYYDIADEIKEAVDYTVPLYHEEVIKKTASSIIKLEIDGQFKIIR